MTHGVPAPVIRRASPADLPAITALTRGAYAAWMLVLGGEPLPTSADHEGASTRHRFDLLEDGGVLAGLTETVPEVDVLLIENVAVHSDA